jgi:segregation and condensation protein A
LEVSREVITLPGQMRYLRERLRRANGPVRFEELFDPGSTRRRIIVTFLALLELIRRGWLRVRQERLFGPILVWAVEAREA